MNTENCVDHLNFSNGTCPDCEQSVDSYGNTEYQFEFCAFPDCGCDGERLCMAGEANEDARELNIEGMWCSKDKTARTEFINTVGLLDKTLGKPK